MLVLTSLSQNPFFRRKIMSFLIEGVQALTWQQVVMYAVGILLIYLAIEKGYEPSLL